MKRRRQKWRKPSPRREQHPRVKQLMDRVTGPAKPGDPRRHHFVPRFLLSKFANAEGQIAVHSISGGSHQLQHVTDTAVLKDFYTVIDIEHGETLAVEKILAESDGLAAGVIRRLVEQGLPLTLEERGDLAMWISLLHVRGPHTRRTLEALFDQTYKLDLSLAATPDAARARLEQNLGRPPTDIEVSELVEAANDLESFEVVPHQNDLVRHILDVSTYIYPALATRHIAVFRLDEPGLILCDRPLILYQRPENRHSHIGVGILNADELWLPLDRRTAIILHKDDELGDFEVSAASLNLRVEDFNQAVALNADTEIYSHPDDVSAVEGLDKPGPQRPLMQVTGGWVTTGTDGVNEPPVRKRHRRYRRTKSAD